MIHYHGTPFGGDRAGVARFVQGRHALIPFPRQEDLGAVAEFAQSFCFDNGAFSIWKRGGELDTQGYYRWVDDWRQHPGFDWAIIPDVIDGTEEENMAMLEDWPDELRAVGVPVWHYSDSFDYLRYLVEHWPRIALGSSGAYSSPGTDKWRKRTDEAMKIICDERGRPKVRLHGLRMLNPRVFCDLPLASADSTHAARNSSLNQKDFGVYLPATPAQRMEVIAERIERQQSAAVYKFNRQVEILELELCG